MGLTVYLFVEVWCEYAISATAILLRFFARWKIFGVKNFDLGDIFAAFALVFYTLNITGTHLLTSHGTNIGLTEETAMDVPDELIDDLSWGSMINFMNWFWYMSLLWSLKGVLLMVYVKLGTGLRRQEFLVKCVCVFNICTYVGAIICQLTVCTPPGRTWQVKPYPGDECTMRRTNYVVIGILNAFSDLSVICVPMPLLFKVKVPLSRKLMLIGLFSLGLFCIAATVLRAYYSLLSLSTLTVALGWTSREIFVSTLVACAPGIKPLFSKTRFFLQHIEHSSDKLSRLPGSKLLGMSKKSEMGEINRDGIIHVSRSVDVYHSGHRPSFTVDAYTIEMGLWRAQGAASAADSDEKAILDKEIERDLSADVSRPPVTFLDQQHPMRTREQV